MDGRTRRQSIHSLRKEIRAAAKECLEKERQLEYTRKALQDLIRLWDGRDKSQWTYEDIMVIQRAREVAK